MTLQQLIYSITISESGSMNKAAECLFISQPTLTKAIKELESEIGFSIFIRSGRGVELTADGRDFIIYAKQVCQQYDVLKDKFGTKGNRRKKFGISTQHYSFALKAFTGLVLKYDTADYDFAFRETTTRDVIDDVGNLKSEIGILFFSDYNSKVIEKDLRDNDLVFTPLIECKACVYLSKNHPLAVKSSVDFEELLPYPCISFEQRESDPIYYSEEILAEKDYHRKITINDRGSALGMINELNAYILCSGIINDDINGTGYKMLRLGGEEGDAVMHIGFVTKRNILLSKIGEEYIELLKENIKINQRL